MAEQEFYYTDEKNLQKEQSKLKLSFSYQANTSHNFMFPSVCMYVCMFEVDPNHNTQIKNPTRRGSADRMLIPK